MDLKTTKTVNYVLLGLMAVCCVLLIMLENQTPMWLVAVSVILSIALVSVHLLFWRCPHCRQHLGRSSGEYCSHCGKHL